LVEEHLGPFFNLSEKQKKKTGEPSGDCNHLSLLGFGFLISVYFPEKKLA